MLDLEQDCVWQWKDSYFRQKLRTRKTWFTRLLQVHDHVFIHSRLGRNILLPPSTKKPVIAVAIVFFNGETRNCTGILCLSYVSFFFLWFRKNCSLVTIKRSWEQILIMTWDRTWYFSPWGGANTILLRNNNLSFSRFLEDKTYP